MQNDEYTMNDLIKEYGVVGFTNGCFDLFHQGHHWLLTEARKQCDRLVVAVNSDDSVRVLKPGRPIDSEFTRMRNVMPYADEVYMFDDLKKLLEMLKPDIVFKGGDYKPENVICGDAKVVIIPTLGGYSTTQYLHDQRELNKVMSDTVDETEGGEFNNGEET